MKKIIFFILMFVLAAAFIYAQSEEDTDSEISLNASPIRKPIAGFTVLTASDAQVTTDGKTTQVEDIYVYAGRKFKAVEARLKKVEAAEKELDSRIKQVEKRMADAENAARASEEAAQAAAKTPPQEEQAQ